MTSIVGLMLLTLAAVAPLSQAVDRPLGGESGEVVPVAVTNFPELVKVEGSVAVKGPINQTSLTTISDVVVAPVRREDTNHYVDAGTISTNGFAAVVLSLVGEVKGPSGHPGEVGVLLVPDDDRVLRALAERGQLLLPLEVKATTEAGSPYFAGASHRFTVAFPRYHVYLYNGGDRTVSATVNAYMTN
jgi:hypothetical protein